MTAAAETAVSDAVVSAAELLAREAAQKNAVKKRKKRERAKKAQRAQATGGDAPPLAALASGDAHACLVDNASADDGLCCVCLEAEADHVATGCGHMRFCGGCCKALTECPMCRCESKFIRVFR